MGYEKTKMALSISYLYEITARAYVLTPSLRPLATQNTTYLSSQIVRITNHSTRETFFLKPVVLILNRERLGL
jgi:hypothetical protein